MSATGRNPIIRQWIVTIAGLCAGAAIAMTAERLQAGSPQCVARDLRLVNVIEERGAAQDAGPDQLAARLSPRCGRTMRADRAASRRL